MILSKVWNAASLPAFDAVSIVGAGQGVGSGFRSLYTAPPGAQTAAMRGAGLADAEPELDPVEQAQMEAFTMGFDEGSRVTQEAASADDAARIQLAEALTMLAPVPSGMLSTMLSATVIRLVEQIVGEVEIDIERLVQRCDIVSAFVEDSEGKGALHLHPDDITLLEGENIAVKLVPDAAMRRGCVRLETADGWVEDGPDVRLSRLRALLDDMEGKP
ncbi:flagellar biosynthesis protein [Sphingobium sp. AN558]|uniref:FliH/SctL family protein n=1 Tax=Sphingobium sp. AN558 TaxID=3133442 RepID=UPI0030BADA6F